MNTEEYIYSMEKSLQTFYDVQANLVVWFKFWHLMYTNLLISTDREVLRVWNKSIKLLSSQSLELLQITIDFGSNNQLHHLTSRADTWQAFKSMSRDKLSYSVVLQSFLSTMLAYDDSRTYLFRLPCAIRS